MLLSLLLAFASCNITSNTFDNPDKDKLLLQVISYVLEEGHLDPKDFDDDFSEHVFNRYIEQIDPYKRYFYASDIEIFNAYRYELDDELRAYELNFFNSSVEVLTKRLDEAKLFYKQILSKPFDFSIEEEYSDNSENLDYCNNLREMENRWRQQLKLSHPHLMAWELVLQRRPVLIQFFVKLELTLDHCLVRPQLHNGCNRENQK